jgi:transposase
MIKTFSLVAKSLLRKSYKLDAVSLVTEQNYRPSEAATHLGIDARLLSRWVKESKQQADGQSFRGNGTLTAEQQQIRELKARVKRLEMEREVLKKATVFFASEPR